MQQSHQKQQQQLLVFLALLSVGAYGKLTINYFDALDPNAIEDRSSIAANRIKLWANVTDCLVPACTCALNNKEFNDQMPAIQFKTDNGNLASVEIDELSPHTNYTFVLKCSENLSSETKILHIKTDYTRPSQSVQNLTANASLTNAHFTWVPPAISLDAYTHYLMSIDSATQTIPKNASSVEIVRPFAYDQNHTFSLVVCYINNQNKTLCSSANDATGAFLLRSPMSTSTTTTTTTTITTTGSSFSISAYSNTIFLVLSSLLFLHQIN